mgnify:CR=1 FL=1
MPSYNSISDALAAVKKKLEEVVESALEEEVTDEIRDAEIAAIGAVVYDAYGNIDTKEPNRYKRRYANGGLVDRENMVPKVDKGTLTVTNITPANPNYGHSGYLAGEIVINGGPYDYLKGENTFGDFHNERDFIERTYNDLRQSKWHVNGLKRGLKRQGFDVK